MKLLSSLWASRTPSSADKLPTSNDKRGTWRFDVIEIEVDDPDLFVLARGHAIILDFQAHFDLNLTAMQDASAAVAITCWERIKTLRINALRAARGHLTVIGAQAPNTPANADPEGSIPTPESLRADPSRLDALAAWLAFSRIQLQFSLLAATPNNPVEYVNLVFKALTWCLVDSSQLIDARAHLIVSRHLVEQSPTTQIDGLMVGQCENGKVHVCAQLRRPA